jgi:hypothetical protein
MAKAMIIRSVFTAIFLWASTLQGHEWAPEADHFHEDVVVSAFGVLEPLAASGELRIKPDAIPGYAKHLAFGFVLALADWEGPGDPYRVSAGTIAQAINAVEVLAVLIDAASEIPVGTTAASLRGKANRLGGNASSADYFEIAYHYRLLAVNEADRIAASEFKDRFMQLRQRVVRP